MNLGDNSQFGASQFQLKSANVHDRDTTVNVNTNFDSNTDGIYTDIKRHVSFQIPFKMIFDKYVF